MKNPAAQPAEPVCQFCGTHACPEPDTCLRKLQEKKLEAMMAAQPAKHTDARPAETIPEDLRVDWSTLNEPYVTPVTLAWAIEREQNMQQFAKKVIERTGRAEMRIEVLEAALRAIVEESHNDKRRADEVLYNCRELARAALPAPSVGKGGNK